MKLRFLFLFSAVILSVTAQNYESVDSEPEIATDFPPTTAVPTTQTVTTTPEPVTTTPGGTTTPEPVTQTVTTTPQQETTTPSGTTTPQPETTTPYETTTPEPQTTTPYETTTPQPETTTTPQPTTTPEPVTTTQGPAECFVPGECNHNTLVDASIEQNEDICLVLCQATPGCTWFTFDLESSVCELFETCTNRTTEYCPQCISGEARCERKQCGVTGRCEVSFDHF